MTLSFTGARFAFDPTARARAPKSSKAKPFKKGPKFVEQLFAADTTGPGSWFVELQLPLVVQAEQANGMRWGKQKRASSQIDTTLVVLQTHLRTLDRAAISGITLTRISPGKLDAHDNLRQAFKHVLDGVCAWIVEGGADFNRRTIGKYDDQLIATGRITCHYEQTTHETDKRLQGIRIRLHLSSPSASSTGQ